MSFTKQDAVLIFQIIPLINKQKIQTLWRICVQNSNNIMAVLKNEHFYLEVCGFNMIKETADYFFYSLRKGLMLWGFYT